MTDILDTVYNWLNMAGIGHIAIEYDEHRGRIKSSGPPRWVRLASSRVVSRRLSFVVEKDSPIVFLKAKEHRHGIDTPIWVEWQRWRNELPNAEFYVTIFQRRVARVVNGPEKPCLLIQSINRLRVQNTPGSFKFGGTFWPIKQMTGVWVTVPYPKQRGPRGVGDIRREEYEQDLFDPAICCPPCDEAVAALCRRVSPEKRWGLVV